MCIYTSGMFIFPDNRCRQHLHIVSTGFELAKIQRTSKDNYAGVWEHGEHGHVDTKIKWVSKFRT